jgi:hypothetical protein
MSQTQFNVRLDDATREKLERLRMRYGTYSKTIAVAVDRLYKDEFNRGARIQGDDDAVKR